MARAKQAAKRAGGAKPAKKSAAMAAKGARATPAKPIELYYWPTPNGFKISIIL